LVEDGKKRDEVSGLQLAIAAKNFAQSGKNFPLVIKK
jgi:hypothetical protein